MEQLTFTLLPRGEQNSAFDWMNIDCGATRVGKIRGLIYGRSLTIHSINIFPEFERHGYARQAIEMFKRTFGRITADRVRHTATGFWEKMGFTPRGDGCYVWKRRS